MYTACALKAQTVTLLEDPPERRKTHPGERQEKENSVEPQARVGVGSWFGGIWRMS
jgi:hypothetical protein